MGKVADIQRILGVDPDGIWGPQSKLALDGLVQDQVKASSFADPADVRAFRKCKERGNNDQKCFEVGDNGIGCWDDDVSEGSGPSCALPPETMIEKWGSIDGAKHKLVEVEYESLSVTCSVKDRMPHLANITNGARIDLNPDTCRALGLEPPVMVSVSWRWLA